MDSIFSQRLKTLREERGLTMQKLGEEIGTSGVSIGYYERGERVPDIHILAKMCQFFGVTSDYLIGLEDCRTHEAADISARTGLTEAAVCALEWTWNAEKYYTHGIAIASILSELIEANMQGQHGRSFYEYLEWRTGDPIPVYSQNGEIIGKIGFFEGNETVTVYFFQKHSEDKWERHILNIDELENSPLLPASFFQKLQEEYGIFCDLCENCKKGPAVLDFIRDLYDSPFEAKNKLLLNKEYGIGRLTGEMDDSANRDDSEKAFLDSILGENTPGILSFPVAELVDEMTLMKIRDAFCCFKDWRLAEKKAKEATNAGEE